MLTGKHEMNFSNFVEVAKKVTWKIKNYNFSKFSNVNTLHGFPTWGTYIPGGTLAYPKGYI